eukprot:12482435-Alexandrium_andersonii.AAC.1
MPFSTSRLSPRAIVLGSAMRALPVGQLLAGRCRLGLGREAAGGDPQARARGCRASRLGVRPPAAEWCAVRGGPACHQ